MEKFENATISGYFRFVFDEIRSGKSSDYGDVIFFEIRLQPH